VASDSNDKYFGFKNNIVQDRSGRTSLNDTGHELTEAMPIAHVKSRTVTLP
jgi:hypothetical protein